MMLNRCLNTNAKQQTHTQKKPRKFESSTQRFVGRFFCSAGEKAWGAFRGCILKFLVIRTWKFQAELKLLSWKKRPLKMVATYHHFSGLLLLQHPWPRCRFELWDGDTLWGKTLKGLTHLDPATNGAPTVEISEGPTRFLPMLQDPKPPLLPCSFVKWMSRNSDAQLWKNRADT